jgi:hypothetical protein
VIGDAVVDGHGEVGGEAVKFGAHDAILAYGRQVPGHTEFEFLVVGGGSAGACSRHG